MVPARVYSVVGFREETGWLHGEGITMSGKKRGGKKGKKTKKGKRRASRSRAGRGTAASTGSAGARGALPGGGRSHGSLSLDADLIEALAGLERTGETWEGGRRTMKGYVMDPTPYRPEVAVWLHRESGVILGHELYEPTRSNRPVLKALVNAMMEPMVGPPRRPARVVVNRRDLAVALKPALSSLGISVRVGRTAAFDHMAEEMDRAMSRREAPEALVFSYLEEGRIPPEEVGRFFEAAARFVRAAPWKAATDSQVLEVNLDRWGWGSPVVAIMGNAGIELGVAVYRSMGEYARFFSFMETHGGEPRSGDMPVGVFGLSFVDPSRLAPRALAELREHGWPVEHTPLVPYLVKADPDLVGAPLSTEDYRLASACVDAATLFVSRHRKRFARKQAEPVSEELVLDAFSERGAVTVSGPHRPTGF